MQPVIDRKLSGPDSTGARADWPIAAVAAQDAVRDAILATYAQVEAAASLEA